MTFQGIKNKSHYQAFVKSPSYPILKQLADEILNRYKKQLKAEKTCFGTARNLIRYETTNEIFDEFFNTLEKRAHGKG